MLRLLREPSPMNRIEIWPIVGSLFLGLLTVGCCRPRPTAGGTQGVIHCGGRALDSVQVRIHRREGAELHEIGFGVSGADGRFQLVLESARGPLWLEPGEYTFTLESIGPVLLEWPDEMRDPAQSPLGCEWSATDDSLDLDVPEPRRTD